jgi:hypothetical protein
MEIEINDDGPFDVVLEIGYDDQYLATPMLLW